MVQTAEERKAKEKARKQTPEYKAKQKDYELRPEVKAKRKARNQTPERKAKNKARKQTPEYKAREKAHREKPEVKAKRKAREQTPERKSKRKSTRDDKRLEILQYYSKRLSRSNIPCCNCCGLNSHIDFLEFDHIAGKKEMDSEPELMKLGYSSKFSNNFLHHWIINNKFPDGFQILCKNCNSAKGMIKNHNECPMKNKHTNKKPLIIDTN